VFGGLNRALVAALVAGTALLAPSAALACNNGGPSAVNVYKECVPSGGGSKPTSGGTSKRTALPVSSKTARALAHAGRDKQVLSNLVRNPDLGAVRELQSSGATSTKAPSALGSAFDLGSGPTALLAVLGGTAVLLLGAGGFRGWRRWRGNH
jgi:hypothetical protein